MSAATPGQAAYELAAAIQGIIDRYPEREPATGLAAAMAEPADLMAAHKEARTAWAMADKLRELLDEVGTLAANAPENGAFAVCEEIAMKIAALEALEGK